MSETILVFNCEDEVAIKRTDAPTMPLVRKQVDCKQVGQAEMIFSADGKRLFCYADCPFNQTNQNTNEPSDQSNSQS